MSLHGAVAAALKLPPTESALERALVLSREFASNARELDRTGDFPTAHIEALFAAGLTRIVTGREHGGEAAGLSIAHHVVAKIATGEPSTALILGMHYVNHAAIRLGSRWPAALADAVISSGRTGPALINALQVEPETGSPSYGVLPRTLARRTEDGWRLTGCKRFSTGCEGLTWMIVSALTDEPTPRLGSFAVRHPDAGIRIEKVWNTTGMRATGSHDVIFENVFVPANFGFDLNPADPPPPRDSGLMPWFMVLIGAVYHGIARAARDSVLNFASSFRPANQDLSLSALPLIQDQLGEIEILLDASDRLLASIASDSDAGQDVGASSGRVRHLVIENSIRAVDIALRVAGNFGVSRDHDLERHHRNVICGRTHAPNGALIRAAAAKAALADLDLRANERSRRP